PRGCGRVGRAVDRGSSVQRGDAAARMLAWPSGVVDRPGAAGRGGPRPGRVRAGFAERGQRSVLAVWGRGGGRGFSRFVAPGGSGRPPARASRECGTQWRTIVPLGGAHERFRSTSRRCRAAAGRFVPPTAVSFHSGWVRSAGGGIVPRRGGCRGVAGGLLGRRGGAGGVGGWQGGGGGRTGGGRRCSLLLR